MISKRILSSLAIPVLLAPALLILGAGCQTDSVSDALPAPHLAAPAIGIPYRPPVPTRVATVAPVSPHAAVPQRPAAAAAVRGVPSAWIPSANPSKWTWIIVHHSDSDYGSAAIIDKWHRDRGFDELGYHFVIGNGTNSADGQIEVGPRWTKQKWGAHDNALDNRYNISGIGICLVGNFDKSKPTAAQKQSLVRLISYLMKTYHIPSDRILGHGETKTTDCPGKFLSVAQIRAAVAQVASGQASMDDPVFADQW